MNKFEEVGEVFKALDEIICATFKHESDTELEEPEIKEPEEDEKL